MLDLKTRTSHYSVTIATMLGWLGICIGAVLLFSAFFLEPNSIEFSIFLGLGITLFPAGIFTLLTNYNFSTVLLQHVHDVMDEANADLKDSIREIDKTTIFLEEAKDLGLVRVYPDRASALAGFLDHALTYVVRLPPVDLNQPVGKVVVVGSSLKGIWDNPNFAEKLTEIITKGKQAGCKFSFLLTHPHYSRYREGQESRERDDIAKEILHALAWLKDRDVDVGEVKLYKGTPTCFLMATTERMLINPYPYQVEAYRCFSFEVVPTDSTQAIYTSYWINHFSKPWEGEIALEDHRLVVNALSYKYVALEGPIPPSISGEQTESKCMADVVIIQDTGECYFSLNVSQLPAQVPYSDGEHGDRILQLGEKFSVALLNPQLQEWETLGELSLNERRRGFWHGMLFRKDYTAYLKIGVFDLENEMPFRHSSDVPVYLRDQPLPVLWQWLRRPNVRSDSHEESSGETRIDT